VPGGAGRRGGYGRRQRGQDGEQEASRQAGHEGMRASIDEADLRELKAGCKPGCKQGSADPRPSFNSTGAGQ
jgi:hypothetical protein